MKVRYCRQNVRLQGLTNWSSWGKGSVSRLSSKCLFRMSSSQINSPINNLTLFRRFLKPSFLEDFGRFWGNFESAWPSSSGKVMDEESNFFLIWKTLGHSPTWENAKKIQGSLWVEEKRWTLKTEAEKIPIMLRPPSISTKLALVMHLQFHLLPILS